MRAAPDHRLTAPAPWLVAVLAAAGTLPRLSGATTAVVVALPEMVDRAEVIAAASVERAWSVWEDGRIVTYSIVVADEPVAGIEAGGRAVVRTLGGEIGDIGQRVFGEPLLDPGERFLLFLESAGGGAYRPVGMAQGALPIVRAIAGDVVTPSPDLPALAAPGVAATVQPWLSAPRPLDEVLAEVRACLARGEPAS